MVLRSPTGILLRNKLCETATSCVVPTPCSRALAVGTARALVEGMKNTVIARTPHLVDHGISAVECPADYDVRRITVVDVYYDDAVRQLTLREVEALEARED